MVDDLEQRIRSSAYLGLRDGRPVGPAELALELAADAEAVQHAIDTLVGRGALELNDSGAITGSSGLTLSETAHRLLLDGAEFHTWCALDAIGIPAALALDADIATPCGWCGRQHVHVGRGAVPSESDLVLWLTIYVRRRRCVARSPEHRESRIPLATRADHYPTTVDDRIVDNPVVDDHRGGHRRCILFPQLRRPDDVGQQERHGPR